MDGVTVAAIIQAAATSILVAVTAAYVIFTNNLVQETRRQGRPHVFVEIVNNAGFLETRLKNSGARMATGVTLTPTTDLSIPGDAETTFLTSPLLQTPIPSLPPGASVKETVAYFRSVTGPLRQMDPEKRILSYTVEYKDGSDTYNDTFEIDLSHLLGAERPFPEPDVYHAIGELRDHMTTAVDRTNDILSGLSKDLQEHLRIEKTPPTGKKV